MYKRQPEFYRLRLDNKVINFAVDSTETVSVKAEINDFATAYRIEGSEKMCIRDSIHIQTLRVGDTHHVRK